MQQLEFETIIPEEQSEALSEDQRNVIESLGFLRPNESFDQLPNWALKIIIAEMERKNASNLVRDVYKSIQIVDQAVITLRAMSFFTPETLYDYLENVERSLPESVEDILEEIETDVVETDHEEEGEADADNMSLEQYFAHQLFLLQIRLTQYLELLDYVDELLARKYDDLARLIQKLKPDQLKELHLLVHANLEQVDLEASTRLFRPTPSFIQ